MTKKTATKIKAPTIGEEFREVRPRVRIKGSTVTFEDGSPYKGRVTKANFGARVVFRPIRIELSAAEAPKGEPSRSLKEKILKMAATTKTDWDHVEVTGPGEKHLFDIVP